MTMIMTSAFYLIVHLDFLSFEYLFCLFSLWSVHCTSEPPLTGYYVSGGPVLPAR